MKLIKIILFALLFSNCSFAYCQKIAKIDAEITTNTKELGIKYSEAELILKNKIPNDQFLFTINSVMIKIYKINGRLITLFIDASGKLIACHSQKL